MIKKYNQLQHFSIIKEWWMRHHNIEISADILSNFGYLYFNENTPVAALWLYPILGSKTCWIGWPVTNPDSDKQIRNTALDELFGIIEEEARQMGYKLMWTTSGIPTGQARLEKHQYLLGDSNINQYWRAL